MTNNVPNEFYTKHPGSCGKMKDVSTVQLSIDEVAKFCFQNYNSSCSLKMDIINGKISFLVYVQILLKGLNYVFGDENNVVNLAEIQYDDFEEHISKKMRNVFGIYPYIINIEEKVFDSPYIKTLAEIKDVSDDGDLEDYGVILLLPSGRNAIRFTS